jgi:hypothetical protein
VQRTVHTPDGPLHEWLATYEQAGNDRLDRLDDYLKELQRQGERQ